MATFVAKNSGGVKKPIIFLKEFFFCFVLVLTSGASDQKDSRIHTERRDQPSLFIKL